MRWFAMLLLFGLGACGKDADPPAAKPVAGVPASKSTPSAMPAAMEKMIPIPKDKAQLDRMLAMGYTVHEDHMHPPGVKECAFDKRDGSVIQ